MSLRARLPIRRGGHDRSNLIIIIDYEIASPDMHRNRDDVLTLCLLIRKKFGFVISSIALALVCVHTVSIRTNEQETS